MSVIRNAIESLTKYLHELSTQMYQQQQAETENTASGDANTVDADYEVVDDEKDNK